MDISRQNRHVAYSTLEIFCESGGDFRDGGGGGGWEGIAEGMADVDSGSGLVEGGKLKYYGRSHGGGRGGGGHGRGLMGVGWWL